MVPPHTRNNVAALTQRHPAPLGAGTVGRCGYKCTTVPALRAGWRQIAAATVRNTFAPIVFTIFGTCPAALISLGLWPSQLPRRGSFYTVYWVVAFTRTGYICHVATCTSGVVSFILATQRNGTQAVSYGFADWCIFEPSYSKTDTSVAQSLSIVNSKPSPSYHTPPCFCNRYPRKYTVQRRRPKVMQSS